MHLKPFDRVYEQCKILVFFNKKAKLAKVKH